MSGRKTSTVLPAKRKTKSFPVGPSADSSDNDESNGSANEEPQAKRKAKRKGKAADPGGFPNNDLWYGALIPRTMTKLGDAEDKLVIAEDEFEGVVKKDFFKYVVEKTRLHALADLEIVMEAETPKAYWLALCEHFGIPAHVDMADFLAAVAKVELDLSVPNTKLYRAVKSNLESYRDAMDAAGFEKDAKIILSSKLPVLEDFLALQLYGDTASGLGTMPETIWNLVQKTGLGWILVKPTDRIVPECWKATVLHEKLVVKEFVPVGFKDPAGSSFSKEVSTGLELRLKGCRSLPRSSKQQQQQQDNQDLAQTMQDSINTRIQISMQETRAEIKQSTEDDVQDMLDATQRKMEDTIQTMEDNIQNIQNNMQSLTDRFDALAVFIMANIRGQAPEAQNAPYAQM